MKFSLTCTAPRCRHSRFVSVVRVRKEGNVVPYKSEKQKRFMRAAAHNPRFAKKAGIAQAVAKRFVKHSEKRK